MGNWAVIGIWLITNNLHVLLYIFKNNFQVISAALCNQIACFCHQSGKLWFVNDCSVNSRLLWRNINLVVNRSRCLLIGLLINSCAWNWRQFSGRQLHLNQTNAWKFCCLPNWSGGKAEYRVMMNFCEYFLSSGVPHWTVAYMLVMLLMLMGILTVGDILNNIFKWNIFVVVLLLLVRDTVL